MDEDKHLKSEYLKYLVMLYHIEHDDGIDVGDWPSFEEFLVIRREERMASCALHKH